MAHRTIELTLSGRELGEAWGDACDEQQARQGCDPRILPASRRTLLRLKKHVPLLVELLGQWPEARRLTEDWLETDDGALGGKPDLVVLRGNNAALVIDYKTGLVTDATDVKAGYVQQLLFYGALVSERLGAVPTTLALLSLREGLVEVEAEPSAMYAVATMARSMRAAYNNRVPQAQPPSATDENCQWCPYAARCTPFWEAVEPEWAMGEAVQGTVECEPEHADSGVTTLRISLEHGSAAGSSAILAGVPTWLVAGATIGSLVSALDLRVRSEEPLVLSWTEKANALRRVAVS